MSGRPSWLRLGLRTALARAYPRVVGANREPSWVFFDVVLPLLATVALLYVYRGLGAPPRFEGYVIVGGAMTAFWINIIWMMALQFKWEKEGGNLELYMASPASLMWILVGMATGASFSTTLRALTVVGLGVFAFGVPFTWHNAGWGILAALFTIAALYGVGMMAASLFLKFGRGVENGMQTLQEPVYLLTGAFFPVRALGLGVAVAASVVPLTLGMDALRQLLLPGDALPLLSWPLEVLLLSAYTVLAVSAAHFSLRRMERAAKQDGRLTLRWQ
ncbi:MAG: ABC transporter permease [Actinomycetota bacterium]|nr:ABC transporter permease [Actinomycetota bacterium]